MFQQEKKLFLFTGETEDKYKRVCNYLDSTYQRLDRKTFAKKLDFGWLWWLHCILSVRVCGISLFIKFILFM